MRRKPHRNDLVRARLTRRRSLANRNRQGCVSVFLNAGQPILAATLPACEAKPGEANAKHRPSRGFGTPPTVGLMIALDVISPTLVNEVSNPFASGTM